MNAPRPTRRHLLRRSLAAVAGLAAGNARPVAGIQALERGAAGGASAAGALLAAAPARAQARARAEVLLRWGIIGTGNRARAHIPAIQSIPGMEIAAICDVDEGRLRQAAAQVGNLVVHYRDYRHLLSSPEIDAVLISTPNLFHQDMVLAALAAGKHVLCEKPMATTLMGCRVVKRAIDATDRIVVFGLQLRYAARFQELYRQIRAGKIGRPRFLSLLEYRGDWNDRDVWRYRDPKSGREMNWRYSQAATGGTLNEKSCHYLDLLHWMVGELPQRVSGQGGLNVYRGRETWDHATVELEYPGGARAVHGLCLYAAPRLDFQIIGEEGSLQLMGDHILFQRRGQRDAEQIALPPEVPHVETGMARGGIETALLRLYEEFLQCVTRKQKPSVSWETAMAASKTAFLAERSAEQRREIPWEGRGGEE